jgi:hypothetical protein
MAYPVPTTTTSWYQGVEPTDNDGNALAYSGTFIPEVWSGKLVEKFYDATVLAAIANTDYEGEIRGQGDLIKIRTKPKLTIQDYTAGDTLTYERPNSTVVELLIDSGKYFNAIVDDVQEVQADMDMLSMWADDASEQMKISIDSDVLHDTTGMGATAGIDDNNEGATAGRISGDINLGTTGAPVDLVSRNAGASETEIMDYIVDMGTVLDEQNIPESGRWLLLPAWACAKIKRSELRDASLTGDGTSIARNGRLGMIDRFTIYMTHNLSVNTGATVVYAGHPHALTFASQLTKMETLRAESTFGTIMRGLQIYGYKVVDGTAIVKGFVTKGAG